MKGNAHCYRQVSADADGHAQRCSMPSTITIYTKLDARCDQQRTTVVDCWLHLATILRSQVLSTTDWWLACLYCTHWW